jgi:uncharacterized membrane protein
VNGSQINFEGSKTSKNKTMDPTHIHLLLTHFPIIGTFFALGILAYGHFSKKDDVRNVAFVIFILMSLITIPVFLTGEEAEEAVEHLPGVSEAMIHEHEELAEKAIWLMGLLGILSLAGLYATIKKLSFTKTLSVATLVVSLATFGIFALVGNHGGQIRHSEIRKNESPIQDNAQKSDQTEKRDDD